MQVLHIRLGVTALVVMLCLCSSLAVVADDLFQGKTIPSTLQFKDITQGWKQIVLPDTGIVPVLMTMVGERFGRKTLPPALYYTRGESITCGQETYLIAYRQENAGIDAGEMIRWLSHMDEERDEMMEDENPRDEEGIDQDPGYPPFYAPGLITPEATLRLCLLNMKSTAHISSIRSFDLAREMESTNGARLTGVCTRSLFNLRRLCYRLREYLDEHEETFPKLTGAREIHEALSVPDDILLQPISKTPYLSNPGLSGLKRQDIPTPAETPVFYEATPGIDGKRGVAFLDGRAKVVTAEEWEALKKIWGLP